MIRPRIALFVQVILGIVCVSGNYCARPTGLREQAFRALPVGSFLLFGWLVVEILPRWLTRAFWYDFIILVLSLLLVVITQLAMENMVIRF
jgi:hypothetical protein